MHLVYSYTLKSTTETKIGTWINGKPLYRKTYYVSSYPNSAILWFGTGVNNIDKVIYMGGYADNGNEVVFLSSSYANEYHDTLVYDRVFSGHNNSIRVVTKSNRSAYSGYVWIEYTKTTD